MTNGKRSVIRVVFKEAKDEKGMVQCILREGFEVLRCDKEFKTFILNRTWPVMLPEESLDDPSEWEEED